MVAYLWNQESPKRITKVFHDVRVKRSVILFCKASYCLILSTLCFAQYRSLICTIGGKLQRQGKIHYVCSFGIIVKLA